MGLERAIAWGALALLAVAFIAMGLMGSFGRVLAVLFTPGRLEAQD